jgi:uncharacterized glyoxalase superfamily protein PhnB
MTAAVQIVTPHLVVRDANAALEFYKKARGATETVRVPAQDGKRLMHSEIQINGARIFVADIFSIAAPMASTRYFRPTRSRARRCSISKSRTAMRR